MSDNENKPTQEELEARRKELTDHYEKLIPQLEIQLNYETLLTDIEIQRYKRAQAQVALANLFAPEPEDEEDELPLRTLKRDR